MNKTMFSVAFVLSIIAAVVLVFTTLIVLLSIGTVDSTFFEDTAGMTQEAFREAVKAVLIVMVVIILLSAIFSVMAAVMFNRGKKGLASRNSMIIWSIISLFVNTLAGIFGLIGVFTEGSDSDKVVSLDLQLKELDALLNSGLITQEEYTVKRKQLMGGTN